MRSVSPQLFSKLTTLCTVVHPYVSYLNGLTYVDLEKIRDERLAVVAGMRQTIDALEVAAMAHDFRGYDAIVNEMC